MVLVSFYFDLSIVIKRLNLTKGDLEQMQDLVGKIYDKIIVTEDNCIELGKRLDEVVEETIEPLRETMSEDDVEMVKEMIYKVLYVAEKDGFRLGVHATVKFMSEALTGVTITE